MKDDNVIHAWNLMEKIGTAMLITWDGHAQRARPMAATVRPAEHAIYFLTDARREKVEQIEQFPVVTLAFADTGGEKYVVTSGRPKFPTTARRSRNCGRRSPKRGSIRRMIRISAYLRFRRTMPNCGIRRAN